MKIDTNLCARFVERFFVLVTLCLVMPFAFAQSSPASRAAAVLDSMPHAKKIDEVAISPDGAQAAYIVDGELTVANLSGGASHTIAIEGKLPLREVVWSADAKQLAFLADLPGDVPSAQLWTAPVDGGAPIKRAELKGYAQTPRFSPDGVTLALLFIEGMPRIAGPLQPMTPISGVADEKIYEQRLTVVDLTANQMKQVTPADVYVYEYDWTPDGKNWAAIARTATEMRTGGLPGCIAWTLNRVRCARFTRQNCRSPIHTSLPTERTSRSSRD